MSKTYITIPVSELSNVNWSQVLNNDAANTKRNIAGDTAIVKWSGDMPSSIAAITGKGDALDYDSVLSLIQTPEWAPTGEDY